MRYTDSIQAKDVLGEKTKSLEIRQLVQRIFFPDGMEVNLETLEFRTFSFSPFYFVIVTKKGLK